MGVPLEKCHNAIDEIERAVMILELQYKPALLAPIERDEIEGRLDPLLDRLIDIMYKRR